MEASDAVTAPSRQSSSQRDRKVAFAAIHDIFAMKLVLSENPYLDTKKWNTIADTMRGELKKKFTARNVKERVHHILEKYIEGDRAALRKSGTGEKEQLLKQLEAFRIEFQGRRVMKKNRAELGKRLREKDGAALAPFKFKEEVVDDPSEPVMIDDRSLPGGLLERSLPNAFSDRHFRTARPQQTSAVSPSSQPILCEWSDVAHSGEPQFPEPNSEEENQRTLHSRHLSSVQLPRFCHNCSSPIENEGRELLGLSEYMRERREEDRNVKMKELALKKMQLAIDSQRAENESRKISLEMERFLLEKSIHEEQRKQQEMTTLKMLDMMSKLADKLYGNNH